MGWAIANTVTRCDAPPGVLWVPPRTPHVKFRNLVADDWRRLREVELVEGRLPHSR